MASRSRVIAMSGILAATYFVVTVALAPISYGPIQFRVSEVLKPLALLHPAFALAFGFGTLAANLFSPFGPWDYIAMAFVDTGVALVCYAMRRRPWPAVIVQALLISLGVAVFPLGFGGGLPFWPSFVAVAVSELILLCGGYGLIWRGYIEHAYPHLLRRG